MQQINYGIRPKSWTIRHSISQKRRFTTLSSTPEPGHERRRVRVDGATEVQKPVD